MSKHYWFKFEWAKWRNDPQLRLCSKETRGFWIDAIAAMEEQDTYFLEGTVEELCRVIICTRDEFERSVKELSRTGAATIEKVRTRVKLISRKILKDVNRTEYNRLKKRQSRSRQCVKPPSTDSSKDIEIKSLKEESTLNSSNGDAHAKPESPRPPSQGRIDAQDAKRFGYPLDDLFRRFPDLVITPAQMGLIVAKVKDTDIDKAAWLETMELYSGNHDPTKGSYDPRKVGTIVTVFQKTKTRLEQQQNGTNKQQSRNGSRPTAAEIIASRNYR